METQHSFRRAGQSHIAAAKELLAPSKPKCGPQSPAYLAHVAVECAIKMRLLYRGSCVTVDDATRKIPALSRFFRGKTGHDLGALAAELGLAGIVQVERKVWREDDCWQRLCSQDRPYSIRYSSETLTNTQAREELVRAEELVNCLVNSTPMLGLPRQRKGKK